MFSINYYICKKLEVSAESFKDYWLGEHAVLLRSFIEEIGVRALIKNESLPQHPTSIELKEYFETGAVSYGFIDQWIFNDIEELKEGSRNPQVQRAMAELFASEDRYIDTTRSKVFMAQEISQTYPREPIRGDAESDYMKFFYLAAYPDHIPLQGLQLHMNACHGAMSRLSFEYSMFSKYLQQFRIESTFVNELISERGYVLEPNFAGHAELYINKYKSPVEADVDQESADYESAMSREDFSVFVDKPNAQCFISLEHYVLDRNICVRTKSGKVPVFFSAVY